MAVIMLKILGATIQHLVTWVTRHPWGNSIEEGW